MAIVDCFAADGSNRYQNNNGSNMQQENLSSQLDGVETVFQTGSVYKTGSLSVFVDGIKQTLGVQYEETSGNSFTFLTTALAADRILTVLYSLDS